MRINHFERYLNISIENLELSTMDSSNGQHVTIKNWEEVCNTLRKLDEYDFIHFYTQQIFQLGEAFLSPAKELQLTKGIFSTFSAHLGTLIDTLITMREMILAFSPQDEEAQINIKLPEQMSLSEMSEYVSEINLIFNKMQAFRKINNSEDFILQRVDAGSTWLIISVAVPTIIATIGAAVKVAKQIQDMLIKHRIATEQIRVLKSGANVLETIEKELTEKITKECNAKAEDFNTEHELGLNPEEIGTLSKGFGKLAYLLFKGVEIYASLAAPPEVTAAFPAQEIQPLLDIKKALLTTSKDTK